MRTYTDLMIDREYDQDYTGPIPAPIRYVLVGAPRTGTNLLCDLLYQSGMGIPMEYLTGPAATGLAERWGIWPPVYPTTLLQRRTTPNGVFGLKITAPDEWSAAQGFWPTHTILMMREDRNAQCESLAIAMKTKYWADVGDPEDRPISVPVTEEDRTIAENMLAAFEMSFRGIQPDASISYEYLVNDRTATLRAIITDLFGFELPDDWECPEPRVKKLHYGGAVDLKGLA